MKKTAKLTALLLTLALVFSLLTACGPQQDAGTTPATVQPGGSTSAVTPASSDATTPTDPQPAGDCAAQGEYFLDGSPLGMPMQWYLKIQKDGSFQISTARDYAADKGNGKVAENNGTFVLVYSDSTNEAPKNASFVMKDGNLYFTTPLPIGTANMPGSEETPFIAYCYAHEDLLGEYVTEYVSEGRMGTVLYDISLKLDTGRRFLYTSVFTMAGGEYTYAEEGSFDISGKEISLTTARKVTVNTIESGELSDVAQPETVTGTIENGVIHLALITSPMKADRVELDLETATTAQVAGSYIGYKVNERFSIDSVLKLKKNGKYSYSSDFLSAAMGGAKYYEEGTFTFDETGVTLTPLKAKTDDAELAEVTGAEPNVLTKTGLVLSGKMPTGGMATALTLVHGSIVGTFAAKIAEPAQEGEPVYAPELIMRGDQSFTLTVRCGLDEPFVKEGTFEAEEGMITFAYDEGASRFIAMLSGNSFNAKNVPLNDEGDEESFEFRRAVPADYVGTYKGSHTTESGMGTTVYTLEMTLNEDGSYRYASTFTMGGTTYVSAEEGRYAVNGEVLALKPLRSTTMATIESGELVDLPEDNQTPVEGTLKDGVIHINMKASCMARSTVDLEFTYDAPAAP